MSKERFHIEEEKHKRNIDDGKKRGKRQEIFDSLRQAEEDILELQAEQPLRTEEDVAPTEEESKTTIGDVANGTLEKFKKAEPKTESQPIKELPEHKLMPEHSLKEARKALIFAKKHNKPQEEIEKWEKICDNLRKEQKGINNFELKTSKTSPIEMGPKNIPLVEDVLVDLPEEEKMEKNSEWDELVDKWIKDKINLEIRRIKNKLNKNHKKDSASNIRHYAEGALKERFKNVLPRIFKDVAVHKAPWNPQDTDLDGKTCLGLLSLAGWSENQGGTVTFINPEERVKNKMIMDAGQYNGVAFLKEIDGNLELLEFSDEDKLKQEAEKHKKLFFRNLGLIIDHHPDGAPSASGLVFKLLDKFKLLENNENVRNNDYIAIIRTVEFVDLVDSRGFQEAGKPENWQKSDRTILGLHRFMDFKNLLKFFKEDGGYNRELTDEELKKYGLISETEKNGEKQIINRQEQQRRVINASNKKLEEFKKDGLIINTKFGKTVIDAKGELPGGAFAAQSVNASYLKWEEANKTLFMFSPEELDENLFDKGKRIRKHLWILLPDGTETGLTLEKVLEKINAEIPLESKLLAKMPDFLDKEIERLTKEKKQLNEQYELEIEQTQKSVLYSKFEKVKNALDYYQELRENIADRQRHKDEGAKETRIEELKKELKTGKMSEKFSEGSSQKPEKPIDAEEKDKQQEEIRENVVYDDPKINKLRQKLFETEEDLKLWAKDAPKFKNIFGSIYRGKIRRAERKKIKLENKIVRLIEKSKKINITPPTTKEVLSGMHEKKN